MASKVELKVILIDDDQALINEVQDLDRPGISFSRFAFDRGAAAKSAAAGCDAVAIGMDPPGALALLSDLCGRPDAPPVIALAARAPKGSSLEHMLTLAELRGAALALPKPIGAAELALAIEDMLGRRSRTRTLLKDRERRV